MPIPLLVTSATHTHARSGRQTALLDPWLVAALTLLFGVAAWSTAPLAAGGLGPVTSDTRIELEVPISTSVTPGWETGESVRLPNISVPGEPRDVTSGGWKMSTNWVNGYEVRVRSTTAPALRGLNAVDGEGARSSFQDYRTSNDCPCPWSGSGYDRGIFGYSVSVASTGPAALHAGKWGTRTSRKWRGFTRTPYLAYSTPGGAGEYTMSIHLRSMIPEGGVQAEGSYRAGLVVSAHPIM